MANPIADATQEASGLNAEQINRCAYNMQHPSCMNAEQVSRYSFAACKHLLCMLPAALPAFPWGSSVAHVSIWYLIL